MAQNRRPSLFVGSSSEGLDIAKAIQVGLDYECEVTLWTQGVFGLSDGTLESLVKSLERFDFAILVLTPDDLINSRGETTQTPRDNVLFELGLFMGGIGRDRTFVVHDRSKQLKMPSDLAGVTTASFAPRSDGNLIAALGAVSTLIGSTVRRLGTRTPPTHQINIPRRVIGIPPTIFVTGGIDTMNTRAFDIAYELGRMLGDGEALLLSGAANGVDESFSRGVAEALASRNTDVKKILTCYTDKGRSPKHRFGRIVESRYQSRSEGIPELISESNIVVTLGGGRNTQYIGILALLEGRFLLPVASSSGASTDLYSLVLSRFDSVFAGKLDKQLFADLADLNSSTLDAARACINAIKALISNAA